MPLLGYNAVAVAVVQCMCGLQGCITVDVQVLWQHGLPLAQAMHAACSMSQRRCAILCLEAWLWCAMHGEERGIPFTSGTCMGQGLARPVLWFAGKVATLLPRLLLLLYSYIALQDAWCGLAGL